MIDPATNTIYAVATILDPNGVNDQHFVVGYDLGSGAPRVSRNVDPPGSDPRAYLQRAALALDGSEIVVPFGGNAGDCGTYRGSIVATPETGAATSTYQVQTGAGQHGGHQESVLKLDAGLNLVGDFTPANWPALDAGDTDVGSSQPLLLPGGLIFQIGKAGLGYLLAADTLGGAGLSTDLFEATVCPGAGSYGGGVYAAGTIYVECSTGLRAVSLNPTVPSLAPVPGWTVTPDAIGPPIIAGGLVWVTSWNTGTLYGLDLRTGAVKYEQNLGSFDHFATPSAGGGGLFVANGNKVTALRIATPPAPPTPLAPPPPPAPPTLPAPSAPATRTPRPVLSQVSLRPSAFLAGTRLRLRLTLTERALVIVVITRRVRGHDVRGRCRVRARTGRNCTLRVPKLRLALKAARGPNALGLRIRGLPPGLYTLTLSARASPNRTSKPFAVTITILRRSAGRRRPVG